MKKLGFRFYKYTNAMIVTSDGRKLNKGSDVKRDTEA